MTKRALNPEGLPAPVGPYSNVVTSAPGRLVFVAGQVALDARGGGGEAGGAQRVRRPERLRAAGRINACFLQ